MFVFVMPMMRLICRPGRISYVHGPKSPRNSPMQMQMQPLNDWVSRRREHSQIRVQQSDSFDNCRANVEIKELMRMKKISI